MGAGGRERLERIRALFDADFKLGAGVGGTAGDAFSGMDEQDLAIIDAIINLKLGEGASAVESERYGDAEASQGFSDFIDSDAGKQIHKSFFG